MSLITAGEKFYYSPLVRAIFRNSVFCLGRELKGCDRVLDLGCGRGSSLQYYQAKFSVGVDYSMPYLLESKRKGIHKFYVRADLNNIEFKPGSFDAVLLLDVIEHLDKESALKLLDKAIEIARKKIIIISPNGYLAQCQFEENELQVHKSGWEVNELTDMGFKAYGLNGLKLFRKDGQSTLCRADYENSLSSTIKFKLWVFVRIIAELSQIITYYFPSSAFEVFYVKDKEMSGG